MDGDQIVAKSLEPLVPAAVSASQSIELSKYHLAVRTLFQAFPFDLPTPIAFFER